MKRKANSSWPVGVGGILRTRTARRRFAPSATAMTPERVTGIKSESLPSFIGISNQSQAYRDLSTHFESGDFPSLM